MARSVIVALALCVMAVSLALGAGQGTPVLISADRACSVKVDGEDVAILSDETPKKIFLAPGEHLFTAVAIDKATWKEVVTVGADQKVVSISFPKATPAPGAKPVWEGIGSKTAVKARTGINEIGREKSSWVVKAVEKESPADKAGIKKGDVLLQADGESLNEKSYEQMQALDKGDAGSTVTLSGIDKKGMPFKVTISRQVIWADVTPIVPLVPVTGTGGCYGIASPCSQRTSWTCGLGKGCFTVSGKCTGVATACFFLSGLDCTLQPGCTKTY